MTDIVERFEHDPYDPYNMIRDPRDGEWVRYSDFAALSAKLAEAERSAQAQYDENVNRIAAEGAAILRAEAAEARVAELEKALFAIAHTFTENGFGDMVTKPASYYQDVARAALATKEPKP
jgi:hypothetical protein